MRGHKHPTPYMRAAVFAEMRGDALADMSFSANCATLIRYTAQSGAPQRH